jgi:hypothetical protein
MSVEESGERDPDGSHTAMFRAGAATRSSTESAVRHVPICPTHTRCKPENISE